MKRVLIAILVGLVAVSAAFAYYVIENEKKEELTENATVNVTLIINFGNETEWQFGLTLDEKNATVFYALLKAANENGFNVEYTYYGQYDSYFVDSIAGAGGDGKFWIYYVNGVMGEVGADKKVVGEGDMIEWRLEEFS